MFKRLIGLVLAAFVTVTAHAAPPVEGVDYKRLKSPQPVTTGSKIEVAEFFWYRCPHCFQLEPALQAWQKKLPRDAEIRRVPAVFSEGWLPGARLYYSLKFMKLEPRLHAEVFDAYHLDNLSLDDPAVLGDWIAKQGVDRKKFMEMYNSPSVHVQAAQGSRVAAPYELRGVPAFVVDGKYATSQSMTGSEARLFETLDALIAKARAERKKR